MKRADLGEEEVDRIRQWAWDNYKKGESPKPYWHEIARDEWIKIDNIRRRKTMYLTFSGGDLEDYTLDTEEVECDVEVNGESVGVYYAKLEDVGVDTVDIDFDNIVRRLMEETSLEDFVKDLCENLSAEDLDRVRSAAGATNTELSEDATGWLNRFDNDSDTASLEDKLRGAKERHLQLEEMWSHMAAIFRFLDPGK